MSLNKDNKYVHFCIQLQKKLYCRYINNDKIEEARNKQLESVPFDEQGAKIIKQAKKLQITEVLSFFCAKKRILYNYRT